MYPIYGGIGAVNITTHNPELDKLARKLLEALEWNGPAQNEFKFDPCESWVARDDRHPNSKAHKIIINGRKIKLGPKEFKLLKNFLEQPQRVFSRDQLLDKIWGENIYVEPRTVDVHIRRLRKAITANNEINIIRTVRDAGYSLEADV